METEFWKLKHCSKLDVLTESQHLGVILRALRDPETCIERVRGGTFTLFGQEEALLAETQSPELFWTMLLYQCAGSLLRTN